MKSHKAEIMNYRDFSACSHQVACKPNIFVNNHTIPNCRIQGLNLTPQNTPYKQR